MYRKVMMGVVCGIMLCLSMGCASIVSKSKYSIAITSTPEDAAFTIINHEGKKIHTGKTPATVTLRTKAAFFKGEDYDVTFTKTGFPPVTARIARKLDGWYLWGNLGFGGLIGYLIVDPATGAMWKLKDLHVDLANPPISAWQPKSIQFLTYNEVPESIRPKLIRIQ
jgi:hypothetical protein